MNDIKDAIEGLKSDIAEKNALLNLLENFNVNTPLDELTFHRLCDTKMRTSKVIGEALEKVFPFLAFSGVGANHFCFNCLETKAISVRIPNYNTNSIELVLEPCVGANPNCYYFDSNAYEEARYSYKSKMIMNDISVIQKNLEKKAVGVFTGKKKELMNSLAEKQAELEALARHHSEFVNEHNLLRKEQQEMLSDYAERFLKWTKKVYVYQRHWESVWACEYYCEDGKLVRKERE